ncbi:hypothetical protein M758_3G182000 [Ceratodon purpureus]|uniref:Uncharacterized protein n=1 Tax=Ceratodon purpureus TaxID=3225 RepID=A0A8T0IM62_CERPU|nr:hypothetical protein KC19_3G181400 [Ceratodon purpureus]KAG0623548.1 hypothetical protein M758_3G182000 [Ceratodon purpureus]
MEIGSLYQFLLSAKYLTLQTNLLWVNYDIAMRCCNCNYNLPLFADHGRLTP